MEIEKKYLVDRLPDGLENYYHFDIEQGYLCTSPTLRIRRMGDVHILTVKEPLNSVAPLSSDDRRNAASAPIVNREEEFCLSAATFEQLRQKCDGHFISKTRYKIDLYEMTGEDRYKGLMAELDVFHGKHEGLLLVEVEFPDETAANLFVPPSWFGNDVSSDYHYRNSFLSQVF